MSVSASIRQSACLLACAVAMASAAFAPAAFGQELPIEKATGSELRQALIWTGHFELWDGDPLAALQKASKSWQAAKGYEQTDKLSEDQANELMAEAVKHRSAVGWSVLEDKSVGVSLGVPTKLAKLAGTRTNNSGTMYDFDGKIGYSLGIRYGEFTCSNFNSYYAYVQRTVFSKVTWRARAYDTFALFEKRNGQQLYLQATCRTSGVAVASISLTDTQARRYGELFGALADSLVVTRNFNPTAVPRPKIEDNDDGDDDLPTDVVATASSKPKKLPPNVDGEGKSARIELQPRDGDDLSTREVFDKVSEAVYVVKAQHKMGSGVAINDRELLTNCHVVDESPNVTIARDKKEQNATVVSMNVGADRCVLRAENKLPSWVKVRPYDDIKVGERAITVGTPQGLELTVAEGLVSSKRSHKGSRLVQTSAPISHGSSGGGLFDARGELLGITTFYFAGGQNLNFAVAAEEFAKK